jgi:hypothetical protein
MNDSAGEAVTILVPTQHRSAVEYPRTDYTET